MSAIIQTRAMAAKATQVPRHPESDKHFTEGVKSIFRQWTALELAVTNQWGGPSSSTKANAMIEDVLKLFQGPDKVYKDVIQRCDVHPMRL
jgi:Pre-rRNA-processing protein TSR2